MSENKISNFHTHTLRCNHASGNPADYFLQAKLDGCNALGFSDHCPYPDEYVESMWPHVRMSESEADDYICDVQALERDADLPVYFGFECEWDKNFEWWYRDKLLGEYAAEYLVLGSHWLTKGQEHVYAGNIDETSDLHEYIDQTIEAMNSGLYAFVAHPDIFMSKRVTWGSDEIACFDAIIDAAEDLQMPLEINGLGMRRPTKETVFGTRFQYPLDEFWERVAARNVPVICNADAHDPSYVISGAIKAREFAQKFGITVIDSIFANKDCQRTR